MGKYLVLRNCTAANHQYYQEGAIVELEDEFANRHFQRLDKDYVEAKEDTKPAPFALSQVPTTAKAVETAASFRKKAGRPAKVK
jgi:hypothetical protein